MAEEFYQQQYFDQLSRQIADLQKDVKDIKSKVMYMYGFAAAIGIFASAIIDWVRTHFVGH